VGEPGTPLNDGGQYIWTRTAARVPPKLATLSVWNGASVSTLMHFSLSPLFCSNSFLTSYSGPFSTARETVRHGPSLVRRAFPDEASCRPFVPNSQSNSILVRNAISSTITRRGVRGASTCLTCASRSGKPLQMLTGRDSTTPEREPRPTTHGLRNTLTHPVPRLHWLHKRLWHL
jgi:hypothetical protein